ncbi:MAG: aspartate aminotransferase family protein [Deltaproteobacteria bacterium]|nr:aspartate aminotransferase family protein [Deltaproteobacteria bacterium]
MNKQATPLKSAVFKRYAAHVSSGKTRFFADVGIEFVPGKREGPFVWDIDGEKRLINCHSNGGVFNLGHRNPEIIAAMTDALQYLDIGNHHLVSSQKAELAEMLSKVSPAGMDYVIFGVSGGEAVDTAIKIARKATGRRGIISATGGFHGHTGIAVATGAPKFSVPFLSDSPDFKQVPFNDVKALAAALGKNIAAVILETIPATLGMPIPDHDYFSKVKTLCEQNGSLLIMDEVQTGIGRTGRFWGIEHFEVAPDMIVSAKGLGGGIYPVTATIIQKNLESVFHDDPFIHISTTGGADIGCMVAKKVIEISSADDFLRHVNDLAEIFAQDIGKLAKKYPDVLSGFRQKGLMCGIVTKRADFGPLMTKACYDAGLLCIYAGNDTSVVQFLPPLIMDSVLCEEIIQRLDYALEMVNAFV